MGVNDSRCPFPKIPRPGGESWLTGSTYPQNIPGTSGSLLSDAPIVRRGAGKTDQTACKPGSVPPSRPGAAIIPLGRPSRNGSRDLPGSLGPTTALPSLLRTQDPYSVLLLAGLAMRRLSPAARWA